MTRLEPTIDPLALLGAGANVMDLSRPMVLGMPQSPNHPEFRLSMPRRHGDVVRADGGSAANDLLISGTHVGTHIDALGHVSHCGSLFGGVDAEAAQIGGRLSSHGVDEIPPIVGRGVLLDVAALYGTGPLPGGYEITPADLDESLRRTGTVIGPGDSVLIRSGWGQHWDDGESYLGATSGVPGIGEAGARWFAERRPVALGADTIAFECLAPARGHALLPAHRVLLVEHGIYIIETMALEELAAVGATEFALVVAPLHLVGATGSPVRPLAVLAADRG